MVNQETSQEESIIIRTAKAKDLAELEKFALDNGIVKKSLDYYIGNLERQVKQSDRAILLAHIDDVMVGYCILNWKPKYGFYQKMNIPEIQDLNVAHDYRQRGIATYIVHHCENMARKRDCEYIGISVGLSARAGAAQKLYFKLGYEPDGNGVTYDRVGVAFGEIRAVDDNLCLMMLKALPQE